ncbi:MAG: hypothetical protein IH977_05085 [Nitrospinae bacterium]|nr:hypothetical protein [Nitrospinota bacterium]
MKYFTGMSRQKDKGEVSWAKRVMCGTLIFLWLAVAACSHWREAYLDDGINEATQEEVVNKLGKPWRTKTSLLNGKTTWTYRYVLTESELDPLGLGIIGRGVTQVSDAAAGIFGQSDSGGNREKPICIHYLLTFDKRKTLQDWKREDCSGTPL